MKILTISLVVIVMVILLGVGILALNKQFSLQGQAQNKCPVPVISEENNCPDGMKPLLTKDADGCFVLQCQK